VRESVERVSRKRERVCVCRESVEREVSSQVYTNGFIKYLLPETE
jgi:hypothetical protein